MAWRFVTFRDWDPLYKWPFNKTAWFAANKVGYVTRTDQVLYPYHYGIRQEPLSDVLKKRRCTLMEVSRGPPEDNLERFFTENYPNPSLFSMGFYLIKDYPQYFDHPIRLPILDTISEADFYARWDALPSVLEPGDSILSTDTESWISRSIARFDHGPWSHTATYIGRGLVVEATTAGVICREIEAYRHPRFRIGIYRVDATKEQLQEMVRLVCSQIGGRYNYYGVLQLAAWKLRNRMPSIKSDAILVSPNDFAFFNPNHRLIHIV